MAFSAAMRRHVHVWIGVLLILLAGCTTEQTSGKLAQDKVQLLWPSPPEQPRFIYETSLSSAPDIVKKTNEERIKRVLSGQTNIPDKPVYDKPSGVAVRHGRVYVADPASRAIIVFDAARR